MDRLCVRIQATLPAILVNHINQSLAFGSPAVMDASSRHQATNARVMAGMVDSADGLRAFLRYLFHCGDPVFPESQHPLAADSFSSFWSRLARLAGKVASNCWTHHWWSALPVVPAAFRRTVRHVVGDPTHLLTVKVNHLCAMFFIAPPRKSSQCSSGRVLFAGYHACLLLVTVDFELGPLSRSLAGLSTLPDQKLSWHASGTARTCRGGYVRHVHASGGIVSPPSKIRFSGWWCDSLHLSNIHSAAVRSSAVPHLLPLELQHPVSPQEDRFLAGQRIRRILGRKRFYIVFC